MLLISLSIELVLLFFLSHWLVSSIYGLTLILSRSRSIAVSAMTLLLFPGTVVHELSHLFVAEIVGVATGKLTLAPEHIEEREVRVGSVQIARTDPFRRYLIGLAPVLVGLVGLAALSYWLPTFVGNVRQATSQGVLFTSPPLYLLLFAAYLVFAISNTMFSSRTDLEGFIGFAIVVGLFLGAGYLAGIRIGLTGAAFALATRLVRSLVQSMAYVLAVNGILLLIARFLILLSTKMTKRKLGRFHA